MIGAPCQSSNSLTRTRTVSSRQVRQRGSLRSKSALRGSAALVIVLTRKWLQPSGFTQNVQRTQRIIGGQNVILTRSVHPVSLPGVMGVALLHRRLPITDPATLSAHLSVPSL